MKAVQMLMMNKKVESGGYGYIYNFYAASDANFAPTDWKVPVFAEANSLITELGGSTVAGGKMKEAGFDHWLSPNTGADNSSGFTAFGGGFRLGTNGEFESFNSKGYFWCGTNNNYYRMFSNNANGEMAGGAPSDLGMYIRLLYTGAGTPTTVTDNDGNVYDVVLIGTQRWTVQNWKCTTLDNGTSIPNVTDNTAWSNLTTLGRCAYDNNESNV